MKTWNAEEYKKSFSFVTKYGEEVAALLDLKNCKNGLDVGCGNGALTNAFCEKGIKMDGIDSSSSMIEKAKSLFPNINYYCDSIINFVRPNTYDFVFSNACFHWISDHEQAVKNIYTSLKPNGQFVLEFGGYGNCKHVHDVLREEFTKRGYKYQFNFNFKKVGEFTKLLEDNGFLVTYATLFNRPTCLAKGNDVRDWIKMFETEAFAILDAKTRNEILDVAYYRLKPILCDDKGDWYIDYVRIRVKAIKEIK